MRFKGIPWSRFLSVLLVASAVLAGCDNDHPDLPPPTATPTPTDTLRPTATPTATPIRPTPTPVFFISSVYPPSGTARGGTAVAIEGAGFGAGVREVRFGSAPATQLIRLTDGRLSCLTPPGTSGAGVPVTVVRDDGLPGTAAGFYQYLSTTPGSVLRIEPVGLPSVDFDRRIGTTSTVIDYLVRDGLGRPVPADEIRTQLFLDGTRLGTGGFDETVLGGNAEELELDLFLMLVLDASFSLQQFGEPQFSTVLQSAEELVARGADIWSERAGSFQWSIVWFNELLARPDEDHLATFRITNIPQPEPGDFTKLYSAVSSGLDVSQSLRATGVAADPRDRHVAVVFTDGRDNLSAFDNPDVEETGLLTNGDPYRRFGWRSTDLDAALVEIAEHPAYPEALTLHTIALGEPCEGAPGGTCFDRTALEQMAQVGLGRYFESLDDSSALFDQVLAEFETLRSDGARMPLPPGTYTFDLFVERTDGRASGELGFLFTVTETGAQFLSYR